MNKPEGSSKSQDQKLYGSQISAVMLDAIQSRAGLFNGTRKVPQLHWLEW